jgi:hypothetical protein
MVPLALRNKVGELIEFAWVDEADYTRPEIGGKVWRLQQAKNGRQCAKRNTRTGGKFVNIYLHRELLGLPHGEGHEIEVDHQNFDALDNRRSNLVAGAPSLNRQNAQLRADNASRRRGVHWHKAARKWCALIGIDGKQHYIGLFATLEEAAAAYDAAVLIYHINNLRRDKHAA